MLQFSDRKLSTCVAREFQRKRSNSFQICSIKLVLKCHSCFPSFFSKRCLYDHANERTLFSSENTDRNRPQNLCERWRISFGGRFKDSRLPFCDSCLKIDARCSFTHYTCKRGELLRTLVSLSRADANTFLSCESNGRSGAKRASPMAEKQEKCNRMFNKPAFDPSPLRHHA